MKLGRFLTTLGIGALAGMLLAPKKGSELRAELKAKGKETLDSAKEMTFDKINEVKEKMSEQEFDDFSDLEDEINDIEDDLNVIIDDLKD